jgi:hypothetical protein
LFCCTTLFSCVETLSKLEKPLPAAQISQFLERHKLKKIYKLPDPFVRRSFYKLLASIAKYIPGSSHSASLD